MIKICMFTNTYLPHVGGVARSVHFFAEDLIKMGHSVMILAPEFPNQEDTVDEEVCEVVRVPAIQNFNGSDFSVRIPLPFVIDEKIEAFSPDIIHSHHPFLLGDAAIRAAYKRRLPILFTHHTLYEQYTHYVSEDSEIMPQLAINLSTEYANLCSRIIAPSQSIAELIKERGVDRPIDVVPTGVDLDHFGHGNSTKIRQRYDIPQKGKIIGHLGRLAPEKNLDYLADAVIETVKKSKELLFFLVVGAGPSESLIKDKFAKAGIKNRLILAGEQSGTQLVDSYHAIDVFVFSSQSETQGMVLAEAMAAGLPVVALDAPGVREIVDNNRNGRLLDATDSPSDFSAALLDLLGNTQEIRGLQEGAYKTAESFSRKNSAERLKQLYEKSKPIVGSRQKDSSFDILDKMTVMLQAEWELLAAKTSALVNSLQKA